jgi:hypothetical protein
MPMRPGRSLGTRIGRVLAARDPFPHPTRLRRVLAFRRARRLRFCLGGPPQTRPGNQADRVARSSAAPPCTRNPLPHLARVRRAGSSGVRAEPAGASLPGWATACVPGQPDGSRGTPVCGSPPPRDARSPPLDGEKRCMPRQRDLPARTPIRGSLLARNPFPHLAFPRHVGRFGGRDDRESISMGHRVHAQATRPTG